MLLMGDYTHNLYVGLSLENANHFVNTVIRTTRMKKPNDIKN